MSRKRSTPGVPAREASLHARRPGNLPLAVLAVFVVLCATAEERTFGTISDEQQMLYTAVSMAEFGEMGIARGNLFTVHRKGGDALAPYGLGFPFLEVLPALAAGALEREFGPGSSQTLFVALQILLVTLASLVAGLLARELGASPSAVPLAVLGTGIASPLWAYVASGYSEPYQAVTLGATALFAVGAGRQSGQPSRQQSGQPSGQARERAQGLWAALAGACSGLAVLGKGLNLAVVPFLLLPLVGTVGTVGTFDLSASVPRLNGGLRATLRRLACAAVGAAAPFLIWLVFEVIRFGHPFASYGGQNFTHPLLDGLWRLLVGPSKGLLLYAPFLLASGLGLWILMRAEDTRSTGIGFSAGFVVLLCLSAGWWAWDGTVGWGPRLLVPLVPVLAAAAAVTAGRSPRLLTITALLVALGIPINALGVFQSESATAAYLSSIPPLPLTEGQAAAYPSYFLVRDEGGRPSLPYQFVAATDSALSPLRVHAFLIGARLFAEDEAALERRLASPPWLASRPNLVPRAGGLPGSVRSLEPYLRSPLVWPHLGASLHKPMDQRADSFHAAWDSGQADQILRSLDIGRPDRALTLAERLYELTPSGYTAALYAESLRSAGRRETLEGFLQSIPRDFMSSPSLGVVLALAARDAGDEARAKEILGQVAKIFTRPGITRALERPMAEWPTGLHGMTGENLSDRKLESPRLGKGS